MSTWELVISVTHVNFGFIPKTYYPGALAGELILFGGKRIRN